MLLLQRLHQCGVGIIVSILTGHETNNGTALWLVFPQDTSSRPSGHLVRPRHMKTIDTAGDRRDSDRLQLHFQRQRHRICLTAAQQNIFAEPTAIPDRPNRVDYMPGRPRSGLRRQPRRRRADFHLPR